MTEVQFRRELNRLWAKAVANDLDSWDLAEAASVERHDLIRWLGGYRTPPENQRQEVLASIASRLESFA